MNPDYQQINLFYTYMESGLVCILINIIYDNKKYKAFIQFLSLICAVFLFQIVDKRLAGMLLPLLLFLMIAVTTTLLYKKFRYIEFSEICFFYLTQFVIIRYYLIPFLNGERNQIAVEICLFLVGVFQYIIIWFSARQQHTIKKVIERNRKKADIYLLILAGSLVLFDKVCWNVHNQFYLELFKWYITLLILFPVFWGMYDELRNLKIERDESQKINQILRKNSMNLRQLLNENSIIHHDFKNHIFLLNHMLQNGLYEKAANYLKDVYNPVKLLDMKINTDNPVIDAILNYKFQESEKRNIHMEVDTDRIPFVDIRMEDLCSLLSNVIDNALEACERMEDAHKYIFISVKKRNSMLMIKEKNSIDKKPLIKAGRLLTTKKDKKTHGKGMKNIQAIADRYDGSVTYCNNEKEFKIYIVLNCSFDK